MLIKETMTCRKLKRVGLRGINNLVLLFMTILIPFALLIALSVTKTSVDFDEIRQVRRQPLKADETNYVSPNIRQDKYFPAFPSEKSNGSMQLLTGTRLNGGRSSGRLKLKQIYNLVVKGNAYQQVKGNREYEPAQRERKLPKVIIIGVRKCGTRALINMLSMHPDIVQPLNEIHYFDFDSNYAKGIPWYLNQMPLSSKHQITIEKTPAYFTSKKTPERVRHMNASIKIVLIVRQPTIRVISDYMQGALKHKEKQKKDFSELVMDNGEVDKFYRPVQTSIYCVHLDRWLHYFNRSQFHIVDGDALINNPYKEVKLVERFLGVSDYYSPDNFYFNETKGYFCLRWENSSRCLGENKGRRSIYPNVSEPLIARLNEFFGPYNEIFYNQTRRRFKWETS
ncbi:heparan sulfate glucosamine 3-O-sulfotransferase 1-like [Anneissia japonica]|uniref:heparan sulfate glucosamine 3-O-sulfotransferase 1-like n=1 Tax=Anneissia japonica TaxID=1529436 RepID=UPI001425B31B|nr:heparan sulfate glucosamine 3-O-sulfotransferase 1-like [Anneissia japonica]XP_033122879.1 heparan sulfate glucosamine 3-O-sulfotransferase 1-like [Anneissia japonica]XP_033122880.1 heparan sulfate glucosamine 3-O-sulfotransferase 1-like [Anneissia japonica]